MILSAHQIHFMPGLRFFSKMRQSDLFVFLDDVQYEKREFQNRNKIKTSYGFQYLTVPVITKGRFNQIIKDVEINNSYNWKTEHLKAIEINYAKAKYFYKYFPELVKIYNSDYNKLIDISLKLIDFFRKHLNIKTPFVFSSSLNIDKKSTERLVELCKRLNADMYLSGRGAKSYLDEKEFEKADIKVIWQDFEVKEYPQLYGKFLADLSTLDLLFNCGEYSVNYI
ncbi:MAG: WbqC family protein [Elusimicrobiota bacterium]